MAKLKALARTVDMLGRQQIATVQNAFVELFKNAYDAEAEQIRVDYLLSFCKGGKGLVSICDNGKGMSKRDFEEKWLVVGTDNKLKSQSTRCQTGEKGIGRLSIALLGKIVLVLSRSQESKRFVASLVHWGLFMLDGIELQDIEIPVVEFDGSEVPSAEQLETLRVSLKASVRELKARSQIESNTEKLDCIVSEVDQFSLNPTRIVDFLSRSIDGCDLPKANGFLGTWFIVGELSEMFTSSVEEKHFTDLLQAFTAKTFARRTVDFATTFNIWEGNSFFAKSLLSEDVFFSYEDLRTKLDYFLEGTVDSDGKFIGTLIDGERERRSVEIPMPSGLTQCECGSFDFCLGTLQLSPELSSVGKRSPLEYKDIAGRLRNFGGLYVYRDGIRILPYGSKNAGDWAEVDKRRVHAIGRYFLSSRNLIGAVLLARDANSNIQEKAGREGFQNNRAYKHLRAIVLNILTTLSAAYLSVDKEELDRYKLKQENARRRKQALLLVKKENAAVVKRFSKHAEKTIEDYETGAVARDIEDVVSRFKTELRRLSANSQSGFVLGTLRDIPTKAFQDLDKMRDQYVAEIPDGLSVDSGTQHLLDRYEDTIKKIDRELLLPARISINEEIDAAIQPLSTELKSDYAARFMTAQINAGEKALKNQGCRLDNAVKEFVALCRRIEARATNDVEAINQAAHSWVKQKTELGNAGALTPREYVEWQQHVFADTLQALSPCRGLETLLNRISDMVDAYDPKSTVEMLGALLQAVSDYELQAEDDFEMIQKGVAIGIVEHEFLSSFNEIKYCLKEFESLAKLAPAVAPLSNRIISEFAHLDSFISVLSPLQRKVYSKEEEITGQKILAYLNRAFASRIERESILIDVREEFKSLTIRIAPAVLYPILINLIDNAIYWVSTNSQDRRIILESRNNNIVISNNGPSISEATAESIFSRGFSLKPGGRGLGLFIAREVLRGSHYELDLESPAQGCNVAFAIKKVV